MVLRKKRNDTKIKNVSGLPSRFLRKHRSDMKLGTLLKKERVTALNQLRKKKRNR
jgi:hypothetical protein